MVPDIASFHSACYFITKLISMTKIITLSLPYVFNNSPFNHKLSENAFIKVPLAKE
jgi:hypothetical protein